MPHAVLTQLLIIQDRDARRRELEKQIAALPADRAHIEQSIAAEHAAIEAAKSALLSLETRKKLLETEISAAETKLSRYRTQQLSVKKNEEYQALGKEIETLQTAISALEDQQIGILYEIDEARKTFATAENSRRENIARHQARLAVLDEREASLRAELAAAINEATRARVGVPEPALRIYERTAARLWPVVAPLRGSKCGGCHLRVSAEAESGARSTDPNKLGQCDQCGRLLYWDA